MRPAEMLCVLLFLLLLALLSRLLTGSREVTATVGHLQINREAHEPRHERTFRVFAPRRSNFLWPSRPSSLNVTFGIKHLSTFADRRQGLCRLIQSVRESYENDPIMVAYDGEVVYAGGREPCAASSSKVSWVAENGISYLRLRPPRTGLSAGRNAIARSVQTEFVMIMDEDVEFIKGVTRVEVLVQHLIAQPSLMLAAACHAGEPNSSWSKVFSNPCYAHNLTWEVGGVIISGPSPSSAELERPGLQRAHLMHNVFVARSDELRAYPWDERQLMMEHTNFFAALQQNGKRAGFDPSVRVLHDELKKAPDYKAGSERFKETAYLGFLCRNFPRVHEWRLPFFEVNCDKRTFTRKLPPGETWNNATRETSPLDWNVEDDTAVVEYRAPKVTCFIAIASATHHAKQRDELRASWLRPWGCETAWGCKASNGASGRKNRAEGLQNKHHAWWDYAFFLGHSKVAQSYSQSGTAPLPPMRGDVVRLPTSRAACTALSTLRWAVRSVNAELILKVDEGAWVDALGLATSLALLDITASTAFFGMITSFPTGLCEDWCHFHGDPWLMKCAWEQQTCSRCSQCKGRSGPGVDAAVTAAVLRKFHHRQSIMIDHSSGSASLRDSMWRTSHMNATDLITSAHVVPGCFMFSHSTAARIASAGDCPSSQRDSPSDHASSDRTVASAIVTAVRAAGIEASAIVPPRRGDRQRTMQRTTSGMHEANRSSTIGNAILNRKGGKMCIGSCV